MPISPQITITPEDITTKNFDISAVTYTSSTATYTATGHTFSVGDIVLVSDLAPDGYNGTFTITGIATNTFTVANTTNTAVTDAVGNSFWTDPTEYSYEGLGAVYSADSDDLAVITSALSTVETAVNGKNKIYRQSTAPSSGLVVGDIWFDTSNGNRQSYWNGTTWVDVQDTAIAAAAAAATAAQSTADGKNKVYRQATSPGTSGNAVGDLWFDTANDNKISRWDGSSWVANTLGNNALASISANKLNAGSIDASVITVSNINAGNISTGTLAAARIAAGSLNASVITAGTITASQIATGTITATQIAAGTITASNLATGTLSANNITTGTLSASVALNATSGTIAGFTLNATTITNGSTMTLYNNGDFYTGGVVSSTGGLYSTAACSFGSTLNVTGTATLGATTHSGTMTYAGIATGSGSTMVIVTTGSRVAYTTSSERFKQEIQYIGTTGWLDKVLAMKPITYKTSEDFTIAGEPNETQYGFLAEDIYDLGGGLEKTVVLDPLGDPFSLSYDRLTVFLMLAIKELKAEIDQLKGK